MQQEQVDIVLDHESTFAPAIHHVNLGTTRLDEMIDWYVLAVGMRVHHRTRGDGIEAAWLSNDGAHHRLALVHRTYLVDDPDNSVHTGLRHTAFEYASLDELLGTYLRLKHHGIIPDFCLDHGMTISFYYADPDGNRVELQVDTYGDWEASTRFMVEDPQFKSDPIGPSIDPEAMVAARQSGADLAAIHARGYAGGFPVVEEPSF